MGKKLIKGIFMTVAAIGVIVGYFVSVRILFADEFNTYTLKEPTCTEDGKEFLTAFGLFPFGTRTIKPLGHDFVEEHTEPNCTEDGLTIKTCSRCGYEEQEVYLPMLGHNYVHTETRETCTRDGYYDDICSRCNEKEHETIVIEHTGHALVKEHVDPTCHSIGYDKITCKYCTYSKYVEYPATGTVTTYPGVAPSCTESGHFDYFICDTCGYNSYAAWKEYGHDFLDYVIAPTCEVGGYTKHVCTLCGHSYIDKETEPLGHNIVHHEGKAASCISEGYKAYDACSRCDYTTFDEKDSIISIKEHSYRTITHSQTTYSPKSTEKICEVCGYSEVVETGSAINEDKVIEPSVAISSNKFKKSSYKSYHDDDYTYYIVYGGRVENFAIHEYAKFEWTEGVKALESYPKKLSSTGPAQLQENVSYKSLFLSSEVESVLTANKDLGISSLKKNDSLIFNDKIEQFRKTTDYSSFLEISNDSYAELSKQINALCSDYSPEFDKYRFDRFYAYEAVVDLDMFYGVRVNLENGDAEYNVYTSISNLPQRKLFVSDNENIGKRYTSFKSIPNSFTKGDYSTNHPILTFVEDVNPDVKLSAGFTGSLGNMFGGDNYTMYFHGINLIGLRTYFESGYDMAYVDYSYTLDGNNDHSACALSNKTHDNTFSGTFRDGLVGGYISGSHKIPVSYFVNSGGIDLVIGNKNLLNSFVVKNVYIKVQLYSSKSPFFND